MTADTTLRSINLHQLIARAQAGRLTSSEQRALAALLTHTRKDLDRTQGLLRQARRQLAQAQPSSVPCDYCGAPARRPCRSTLTGLPLPTPHTARLHAARTTPATLTTES